VRGAFLQGVVMENKIIQEVAEADFNRFADMMDLDFDVKGMGAEDRAGFENNKRVMVNAIMRGELVVNDKGEPVYTCQRGDDRPTVTFHEPTGATFMAMDRKKKNEDIGKTYASMADMCKVDAVVFAKMKYPDLKVCQAVFVLFLGECVPR
jgi:hypothetical protein